MLCMHPQMQFGDEGNRIPIDDILHDYADTINYDNIYTYAAHGVGGFLFRPGTTLKDIAKRAKESGKDAIMLIACEQSKDNTDISDDAQQLANYSGLPVIFSHNYVHILPYITPLSFSLPWNNPWDTAYPRRQK